MGFEIGNESSSILQRSLALSSNNLQITMAKLANGEQTKAIENAANLIISESMESQKRGSQVAYENAQTGMNMLQTAESDMSAVNDNLQRMRELSLQSENGTTSEQDREAINKEINALSSEIDRVSKSSSFNGINLLDGSNQDVSLQIGANSNDNITVGGSLGSFDTESLDVQPGENLLSRIDNALQNVQTSRSDIGAMQNRLESTVSSLSIQEENLAASQSRLKDVDVASEVSKLTQNQILMNSSVSLLAQANQSPSIASMLIKP